LFNFDLASVSRARTAHNIVLAKAGGNTVANQISSYARLRQYFHVVRNLAASNL